MAASDSGTNGKTPWQGSLLMNFTLKHNINEERTPHASCSLSEVSFSQYPWFDNQVKQGIFSRPQVDPMDTTYSGNHLPGTSQATYPGSSSSNISPRSVGELLLPDTCCCFPTGSAVCDKWSSTYRSDNRDSTAAYLLPRGTS